MYILKIKDIPKNERPRERLLKYGVENLSNEELLSIIIKTIYMYNNLVKCTLSKNCQI